ncbi:MAG: pyridoxamine 5'-phosphate oxidase family protein [Myxococcota bacterium]|jgi:hypothetical protein|nr:pyridoxamine 5'-phosphate oxidase family protein [Myxococcota bacterium]
MEQKLNLREYFEQHNGFGVLSTADSDGRVNAAVYARPHCFEDGTVAFIMTQKLSYRNLQSNARAAYLFRQEGEGYRGLRLYLQKLAEDDDQARIDALRRRAYGDDRDGRHLVVFRVEEVLPLVGTGETG